ncbi:gliding motility-associated-like protein [Rhabdobacter roseus]|uniref:Gliding motility-associated-like protein n=1 Tax=Rhabdobacter roseus TaxID=1655419 RepID=A0A840TSC9_9BACT|nr:gliding motility-associated C-terminal domain-containing protein [Rhabdobacter roseus]MBB5287276.1 gliding motility-associated-like protein [Rhabdobacter roseus]
MKSFVRFFLGSWLLLVLGPAQAQQAYVSMSNGDLVLLDVNQCTSQIIGNSGIPMFDIAISPGGTLYGNGANNILYRINRQTAAITQVGPLNPPPGDDFNSLVFSDNGTLYAATANTTNLYVVDTTNATNRTVGNVGYQAAGDLTFFEGNLYLAARNNNLVRIEPGNANQSQLVGRMNANSNIFGVVTIGTLDCRDGRPRMYALGGNELYEVSTTNASVTRRCTNLRLNGTIYGAASVLEASTQIRAQAGRDTTLTLCNPTTALLHLDPLPGPKDAGGTWQGVNNAPLTNTTYVPTTALAAGTYRYHYRVGDGNCADTATVTLNVGVPDPTWPADTVLCTNQRWSIRLNDPTASYVWQDGSTGPSYTVASAGTYTVSIRTVCGSTTSSVRVSYDDCGTCPLFLPDAFSPNGDAHNDVFRAVHDCQFTEFSLQIYNRWGEVIFQSSDPAVGWAGSYLGNPAPPGTYTYRLRYRLAYDSSVPYARAGSVLLLR